MKGQSNWNNRGWDHGESSSSRNNVHEQALDDDAEMKLALTDVWSEDRSPGLSATINTSYVGNRVTDISENIPNYSSASLSFHPNHTLHEPGRVGTEDRAASSDRGTSPCSSNAFVENNGEPGPLFGTWSSSCKRKSVEGSSNSNQHPVPGRCSASRNLSISSNFSSNGHLEQLNSRSGVGTSRVRSGRFASSSVQGITENPVRNFALGLSCGHESVPQPQLRPISNSNSLELMSQMTLPLNLNDTLNESFPSANEADASFSSRHGNSSSSFQLSNTRDIFGNEIDWSFTPGTSLSSINYSGSSISPSSGGRSSSTSWMPHRNQTSRDQRRFSEAAHWIPFSRVESDSGSRRSPFSFSHWASTSSERASSDIASHQSNRRSAPFSRELRGDDTNGQNILAFVEGRHRLIRQVLSAMQRVSQLQDEDYMLIDPFVNESAELHDQHMDMMLDVDNMSYVELLALEEQIGNVSTGLNEEKITEFMKKREYEAVKASKEIEPCCICRRTAAIPGEMIAQFLFEKEKFVWELICAGFKAKIKMSWIDIKSIKIEDNFHSMEIQVGKIPVFKMSSSTNSNWKTTKDFTGGHASKNLFHSDGLRAAMERVLQCDWRLGNIVHVPYSNLCVLGRKLF